MNPRIIALEGVGGSGKSTLAKPLAEALAARLIKRPLTSPPKMHPDGLRWWMLDDARDCLALAAASTEPYVVLDRHWLSACVYQEAQHWPAPIAHYAAALGEPDVWVILSAPAPEVVRRLAARPDDGRHHLDAPARIDQIAGRIALYDDAPRHLKAPVVEVRWLPPTQPVSYERVEIRSRAGESWHQAPMPPWELAQIVAGHVKALTGGEV